MAYKDEMNALFGRIEPEIERLFKNPYHFREEFSPIRPGTDRTPPRLAKSGQRLNFGLTRNGDDLAIAMVVPRRGGAAFRDANKLANEVGGIVQVRVVGDAQVVTPNPHMPTSKRTEVGRWAPGRSVAHADGWAGTIGAFVEFDLPKGSTEEGDDILGFVTASHVVWQNGEARPRDAILSPGPPDAVRDMAYRIGQLRRYRTLVPYTRQDQPNKIENPADIAAVELEDETQMPEANFVPEPGNNHMSKSIAVTSVADEKSMVDLTGSSVYAIGRTSGFVRGKLEVVGMGKVPIKIAGGTNPKFRFLYGSIGLVRRDDEFGGAITSPGDSGAMVYTGDGTLVGFVVAATDQFTIIQDANMALQAVDARLIGIS